MVNLIIELTLINSSFTSTFLNLINHKELAEKVNNVG